MSVLMKKEGLRALQAIQTCDQQVWSWLRMLAQDQKGSRVMQARIQQVKKRAENVNTRGRKCQYQKPQGRDKIVDSVMSCNNKKLGPNLDLCRLPSFD
ncbi:hypothetical protein J1N35_045617 [Gossypium stocksii]|uniref:Uncharacterized protein n=1 Tax=Gossypium stocksii TaxID=47602 RepID=A0A9D3ZHJ5_9ROSI|nr:hypothetical protein J1N35_045617 [Gossypium stocksii]